MQMYDEKKGRPSGAPRGKPRGYMWMGVGGRGD